MTTTVSDAITQPVKDNENVCYLPMEPSLQSSDGRLFLKTENTPVLDHLIAFTQPSENACRLKGNGQFSIMSVYINVMNCARFDIGSLTLVVVLLQ